MTSTHLVIDWKYYPGSKRTATIYVNDRPVAVLTGAGADLLVDLIHRGSQASAEDIQVEIKNAIARPA